MDAHEASLPDHPEDPFPPADGLAPPLVVHAEEDTEDFIDDENEEDDEATLDEEEGMLEDDEDELDDLEAEADMDIEELRKKYYGVPAPTEEEEPCVSSTVDDGEAKEEMYENVDSEAIESAANNYFGVENNEIEEDDTDYEPPEKKEFQIRVDQLLYQAVVPESTEEVDAPSVEHAPGTLLWSPREDVTCDVLNRFVHEWKAMKHGVEQDDTKIDSRDDEDALFALLSSAYSTETAATAFSSAYPANQCQRTVQGDPKEFDAEEKAAFETGFKDNYKNFRVIRERFVPSRTLGELVNYYYHWKKSSRFTEFRRTVQRKDYMTEVMDQMEGNKRRREVAVAADKTITADAVAAAETATATHSAIIIPSENEDDEVEYKDPLAGSNGDPPADIWASPIAKQPTESA